MKSPLEKKSKPQRSFVKGLLIGAGTGLIIGIATKGAPCSGNFCVLTRANKWIKAFSLIPIGGMIGAVIGNTFDFRVPIRGNKKLYTKQKYKLKKHQLSF